jgi:hypothetical protein
LFTCFLFIVFPVTLVASTTTIDFEGFPDSTLLTTQYSGLVFSNAQILTAGISLNEFELPPHSGSNVVSDYTGPLAIVFANPVSAIGGYFTYAVPLTLTAYDSNAKVLGTVTSAFSNNFALSGGPGSSPNELLQLSFSSGISELVIAGAASGGSFALDDLTYASGSTPEPGTSGLTVCLVCAFWLGGFITRPVVTVRNLLGAPKC